MKWALAAAAAALLAFGARSLPITQAVELKSLDWRFRNFADRSGRDPSFVFVTIDQPSLDFFELDTITWPWPRSLYVPFLEFCRAGGAKAVVFDLMLISPSSYGADDDKELGRAVKASGNVVFAMQLGARESSLRKEPPPERFAFPGSGGSPKKSARLPVKPLLESAYGLGDASARPDSDGVFRRVPLLSQMNGRSYPTLPLAAAMAALGKKDFALSKVPLDEGAMLVRYHGASLGSGIPPEKRAYAAYSIGNLIQSWNALQEKREPLYRPEILKDKVVFVAASAVGLHDNHPSPIAPNFPGTEVVVNAADNLVHGDHLRRAGAPFAFLLIALAAAAGLAAARLHAGLAAAAAAALIAAASACFKSGLWIDMASPQLALWLSFAGASAYGYATEGRQKRYIRQAFSQYLSHEVVEQVVNDPKKLALGGERREVTTYFSDIEGFTTISETVTPERLTYMMSKFLGLMTDTVLDSGGTLDKYIGDAVMAFWNAPAPMRDHALRGCKAALDNQRKLVALREELIKEGFPPVKTRIGLNTGQASIGNMGSPKRFSYTAIGDSINLASRLEGANKAYGTYIMISESTKKAAGDAVETRELDFLQVKGKNIPVRVFELLGMKGEVDAAVLGHARRFETALEHYRGRRWDLAIQIFSSLDDAASKMFVERCEEFKRTPPPADWDGSYAMTEK